MNREEMEKKKVFRFSWGPAMDYCKRKGVTPDSLVYEHFRAGWDACAEEYEKEIERLKSWEHFTKTLSVMQTFQKLNDREKEAINLMVDGIKYRQQNK